MSEAWLNFTIIVFVQLIFFAIHAYYAKRLSDAPRILGQGVISGIVLGIVFDLVFGTYFGFWSYALGFGVFFLTLNAALVYGIFAAHVLLMQRARITTFFIWTMMVAVVFEITNLFFHAWTYHFFRGWAWETEVSSFALLAGLPIAYFGTAFLVAVVWHIFFGRRFLFIDNLLHESR